jgi:hypothetical protein
LTDHQVETPITIYIDQSHVAEGAIWARGGSGSNLNPSFLFKNTPDSSVLASFE